MKSHASLLILCTLIMTLLSNCSPVSSPNTSELTVEVKLTPSPTPTPLPGVNEETHAPASLLTGTLEIRFPDPWERPDFCNSEVPYHLSIVEESYILRGEGNFYCHQFITLEEGFKQHLEQDYDVVLSGSMMVAPGSILEMHVQLTGIQDGYYGDFPHGAPEIITASNPFHVEIDQPLDLKFSYQDEAFCLWNQNGIFTSLPGEEPPVGENGWLFILHPDQ